MSAVARPDRPQTIMSLDEIFDQRWRSATSRR
jgi:hypothetical protein